MNGLRIAVPRGALFTETLDFLDRLGLDTAEVRVNDRKLLFEEAASSPCAPPTCPPMSRPVPPTWGSRARTC